MSSETAGVEQSEEDQKRLAGALKQFNDFFQTTIENASTDLKRRSANKAETEAAIQWQVKLLQRANDIAKAPAPISALLDYWALAVRQRKFFQTGEGAALFGANQQVALDASQRVLESLETMAANFLAPEKFEELKGSVGKYAEANPMVGLFENKSSTPYSLADEGIGALMGGVNLALSPVAKVGSAVTATADLPASVSRIADILEDYPRQIFLNAELMTLNLLKDESVLKLVESVDLTSKSIERFAGVAERLPQDVQTIVKTTIDESVAAYPEVRDALERSQEMLHAVDAISAKAAGMTKDVNGIVVELRQLTESVEKLTVTAGEVMEKMPKPDPNAPKPPVPTEPAKPLDMLEVRDVVHELSNSLGEVKGILMETRGLIESRGVEDSLKGLNREVVDKGEERLHALINLVAWRAGQFIALFFGLLLAYKLAIKMFGLGGKKKAAAAE